MHTILILHGWGIGSNTWARVRDILENQGCKVYAPDLPGFGGNIPPVKPWSIDDYVQWVKDYINDLQTRGELVEPFFLLGHSFGGGIAVKFVNRYPQEVQSLILVAPKLYRQRTFRYYGGLVLAKIGKLVFSMPILSFLHPLARKVLYALVGTKDYYRLELDKTNTMKETFKQVVASDLMPYLAGVKISTLIVWGDKDQMTPISDAYLAHKTIENSKLEIIRNGRHALHLENPEILAEKIIKFITN